MSVIIIIKLFDLWRFHNANEYLLIELCIVVAHLCTCDDPNVRNKAAVINTDSPSNTSCTLSIPIGSDAFNKMINSHNHVFSKRKINPYGVY